MILLAYCSLRWRFVPGDEDDVAAAYSRPYQRARRGAWLKMPNACVYCADDLGSRELRGGIAEGLELEGLPRVERDESYIIAIWAC